MPHAVAKDEVRPSASSKGSWEEEEAKRLGTWSLAQRQNSTRMVTGGRSAEVIGVDRRMVESKTTFNR
jgi:hypothetical protein